MSAIISSSQNSISASQAPSYIINQGTTGFGGSETQKKWKEHVANASNWLVQQYTQASVSGEDIGKLFDRLVVEAGKRRGLIATLARDGLFNTRDAKDFGSLRQITPKIDLITSLGPPHVGYIARGKIVTDRFNALFKAAPKPSYVLQPHTTIDFQESLQSQESSPPVHGIASGLEFRIIELPMDAFRKDPAAFSLGDPDKFMDMYEYAQTLDPSLSTPSSLDWNLIGSFHNTIKNPAVALKIKEKFPQQYEHAVFMYSCLPLISKELVLFKSDRLKIGHLSFLFEMDPTSSPGQMERASSAFIYDFQTEQRSLKTQPIAIHQERFLIPKSMEASKSIFKEILAAPLSEADLLNKLAKFEFTFGNAAPYRRGSAAIIEWFNLSMAAFKGYRLHYSPNACSNLVAVSSTYGEFMSQLPSLMTLEKIEKLDTSSLASAAPSGMSSQESAASEAHAAEKLVASPCVSASEEDEQKSAASGLLKDSAAG